MEQKQITLEEIYKKLLSIQRALESNGIIVEDDEGELTEEFKTELEKRRKSKNYLSNEEVKRHIFAKNGVPN